jgi:hypothetical protein
LYVAEIGVELPFTKNETLPATPEGETVAERLVVPPNMEVVAVTEPTDVG